MLPPAQGLDLLEQALACEATPILAGLDAASRAIQPHLEPGSVEAGQDGAAGGHVAPRTPTEHTLARMWEDLLGLRQVSVTADFFDLGGRSLLAARLFARIEAAFGRRLPLATLYKAPWPRWSPPPRRLRPPTTPSSCTASSPAATRRRSSASPAWAAT
jgi:hypothetical protein